MSETAKSVAWVFVRVTRVRIPAGKLAGAQHAYLVASIGARHLGRSRQLDSTSAEVELDAPSLGWSELVATRPGEVIPVELQLWDDRGDEAPKKLAALSVAIHEPWYPSDRSYKEALELNLEIDTVRAPSSASIAHVPRSAEGSPGPTLATLQIRPFFRVGFVAILGLYKPHSIGNGRFHAWFEEGYASEDHLGRAYVNRGPDGNWTAGQQRIKLHVRVDTLRGTLPPHASIRWTLLDRDDELDDRINVNRVWGPELDPNDYQGTPVRSLGARGNDNRGTPARTPPWQASEAHTLIDSQSGTATTQIVDAESKVYLHIPDLAGDNFAIEAKVVCDSPHQQIGARTGTITVWNRLQVEVLRMESARSVSTILEEVATAYNPACIQLDFDEERVVPDADPLVRPGSWKDVHERIRDKEQQINDFVLTHFRHAAQGGWLCLLAAITFEPASSSGSRAETTKKAREVVLRKVPGGEGFLSYILPEISTTGSVSLSKQDLTVYFAWMSNSKNAPAPYLLAPRKTFPMFSADKRGEAENQMVGVTPSMLGFPVFDPGPVEARPGETTVLAEITFNDEGGQTKGISPTSAGPGEARDRDDAGQSVSEALPLEFWWGVSVLFTNHPTFSSDKVFQYAAVRTVVHELGHALGLPHECGFQDLYTPHRHDCVMNYEGTPIWRNPGAVGLAADLQPPKYGTSFNRRGDHFCGRHIRELRRLRLHLHPGFRWKS